MEAVADLQLVSSSPKKGRRSVQKRVVSVPVADGDGGRSKGGGEAAPPSDSWAWRKYGQKPIKGSPYPRGYYRCSSSKGCPARKQVERSRADPTTFLVTYSAEHDHSWPATGKTHRRQNNSPAETTGDISPPQSDISKPAEAESNPVSSDNSLSTDLMVDESAEFMIADSFGWFAQVSSPSSTSPAAAAASDGELFCSSLFGFDDDDKLGGAAVDEEEESLFAGLGELPECSIVFRRGFGERRWRVEEDGKRCGIEADESATSWYGSSR